MEKKIKSAVICKDCDFSYEDGKSSNGKSIGLRHAELHGHKVYVQEVTVIDKRPKKRRRK